MTILTMKYPGKKAKGHNMEALDQLVNKHEKINRLFEAGKDIDPELTKSFVTFPIHNNPFKE